MLPAFLSILFKLLDVGTGIVGTGLVEDTGTEMLPSINLFYPRELQAPRMANTFQYISLQVQQTPVSSEVQVRKRVLQNILRFH